jgi:hypothetical protein
MGTHLTTLAKEMLRWVVIVASGGYGLWQLIYAGRGVMRWTGDWLALAFTLVFPLLVAAPFLAVAYICLRRQYRKLFLVLGVIGCIVVFAGLSALFEQLGMFQFMDRQEHENRGLAFLFLPLVLLSLFGPIYAAAWFFRLCRRLAYPEMGKKPKTRATGGLVWLGVLCLAAPVMIAMFVTFNHMMQSPTASVSPESLDSQFRWIIGLSVIGGLLMFLGLVRRQPITESHGEAKGAGAST